MFMLDILFRNSVSAWETLQGRPRGAFTFTSEKEKKKFTKIIVAIIRTICYCAWLCVKHFLCIVSSPRTPINEVKSLSRVWLFVTSWTVASIHGIFQARVLECVAISFSRGTSRPRDRTRVSRIVGQCFTVWATREAGARNSDFI